MSRKPHSPNRPRAAALFATHPFYQLVSELEMGGNYCFSSEVCCWDDTACLSLLRMALQWCELLDVLPPELTTVSQTPNPGLTNHS